MALIWRCIKCGHHEMADHGGRDVDPESYQGQVYCPACGNIAPTEACRIVAPRRSLQQLRAMSLDQLMQETESLEAPAARIARGVLAAMQRAEADAEGDAYNLLWDALLDEITAAIEEAGCP